MSTASDVRFWDRSSRKYARTAVADPIGYERTLERTLGLLRATDDVLELGCGTGTTALRLAHHVGRYLATDVSPAMIAIAEQRQAAAPVAALTFRVATAETLVPGGRRFDAVLGFNYLHLVRDLPGTLRSIHAVLAPQGLFVAKTPCLGDMNRLIGGALLPAMRAVGLAPHARSFRATALARHVDAAGFDILATEHHAANGNDNRPCIVARKR